MPLSREDVVMASGPGAPMAMVRGALWVCGVGLESLAVTVNEKFPCDVGQPEIRPELGCMDKPGGSEPVAKLQVYGGVPPLGSIPAR